MQITLGASRSTVLKTICRSTNLNASSPAVGLLYQRVVGCAKRVKSIRLMRTELYSSVRSRLSCANGTLSVTTDSYVYSATKFATAAERLRVQTGLKSHVRVTERVKGAPSSKLLYSASMVHLLHSVESEVLRFTLSVCNQKAIPVIPLHDGFLVHPNHASAVNAAYSLGLARVYEKSLVGYIGPSQSGRRLKPMDPALLSEIRKCKFSLVV